MFWVREGAAVLGETLVQSLLAQSGSGDSLLEVDESAQAVHLPVLVLHLEDVVVHSLDVAALVHSGTAHEVVA